MVPVFGVSESAATTSRQSSFARRAPTGRSPRSRRGCRQCHGRDRWMSCARRGRVPPPAGHKPGKADRMSQQNVSQFILARLAEWGVRRVYGYPGDGINGVMGAFHEYGDRIEFIQVRHEELAAFAACAHAKLTGEAGVCMATSGPGAIHLLNGLYDAKLDHQPVVAIVGQQKTISLGGDYQQEVDLVSLFKDVAHEFVQVCESPSQARHLIDRAVRIALATRSVTCVILPTDIQEQPYSDPPREHGAVFSGVGFSRPRVIPHENELARAPGSSIPV